MLFERASCQKHQGVWEKDLAMIHMDEIALLNKRKLYKMFGFSPNPKSLPRKSLRYVQVGASTLLLNCLLYNVYIHFPLLKKKKQKMQTLTFGQLFRFFMGQWNSDSPTGFPS